MCKCTDVAKYFLSLQGNDAGDAISNMKLQKLLYYAQGFALALLDKPLFDEDFEAWAHGPVLRCIYNKYKKHGMTAIPAPVRFSLKNYTDEDRKLLDDVYRSFGQYSAWALSEMTHQTPPWSNTQRNGIITKDSMKAYFSTQVEEE